MNISALHQALLLDVLEQLGKLRISQMDIIGHITHLYG